MLHFNHCPAKQFRSFRQNIIAKLLDDRMACQSRVAPCRRVPSLLCLGIMSLERIVVVGPWMSILLNHLTISWHKKGQQVLLWFGGIKDSKHKRSSNKHLPITKQSKFKKENKLKIGSNSGPVVSALFSSLPPRFLGSWFAPLASHCPLSVEGGSKSGWDDLGLSQAFPAFFKGASPRVLLLDVTNENQNISKPSLPVATGIASTLSTSSRSLQRALGGRWLTFAKS